MKCRSLVHVMLSHNFLNGLGNDLTNSIRTMGIADKTEMVKALQKELERAREVQHKQQLEFDKLQRTCVALSENYSSAEHKADQYKGEIASWVVKNKALSDSLNKQNEDLHKLTVQLMDYKNALDKKESFKNTMCTKQDECKGTEVILNEDRSVQVSQIFSTHDEVEKENQKLKQNLQTAYEDIDALKHRLLDADDQLSKLSMTVSLEIERDKLIKTLQEKAAEFETIITEKNSRSEYVSIGINTEQASDETNICKNEILEAKYEAELIQKEILLRIELQNAYDNKLLKIEEERFKDDRRMQTEKCSNCHELMKEVKAQNLLINNNNEELNLLKFQRQQDRDAVATLLEDWRDKFIKLESDNKEITTQYLDMKNSRDQLAVKFKTKEDGDAKLYSIIKRECADTIKVWNRHMMCGIEKYSLSQQNKIQQIKSRIDEFSNCVDKEVNHIEMQFLQRKKALEQLRRS